MKVKTFKTSSGTRYLAQIISEVNKKRKSLKIRPKNNGI